MMYLFSDIFHQTQGLKDLVYSEISGYGIQNSIDSNIDKIELRKEILRTIPSAI